MQMGWLPPITGLGRRQPGVSWRACRAWCRTPAGGDGAPARATCGQRSCRPCLTVPRRGRPGWWGGRPGWRGGRLGRQELATRQADPSVRMPAPHVRRRVTRGRHAVCRTGRAEPQAPLRGEGGRGGAAHTTERLATHVVLLAGGSCGTPRGRRVRRRPHESGQARPATRGGRHREALLL